MILDPLTPNLARKAHLLQSRLTAAHFVYQVELQIHDVPLRFHVTDESVIKEFYDHYPLSWFKKNTNSVIDIFWTNSRDLGIDDREWEAEPSPDCHLMTTALGEMALQRDFAAVVKDGQCKVIAPYDLHDGFFNFLRWLLPLQFLADQKMLLHSSCILDCDNQAYFSLGPSGAGKSTIASWRPTKKILGDDMNVIKVSDGQCWAQAGALGQAILNPKEYTAWYPVKALLWLRQAPDFKVASMDKALQSQRLLTSVANVFWPTLEASQSQRILEFVTQILNTVPMYELSFPYQNDVWERVFSMEELNDL